MAFTVLESILRPLSYWYNQDGIEEVAINRSGEIWLRLRGKRAYPWVMYKDEKLSNPEGGESRFCSLLTDCIPSNLLRGGGRQVWNKNKTPLILKMVREN